MVLLGVGLALASAIAHAAWNTIVKQVSAGGLAALWAYTLGSSTLAIGVLLAAVGAGGDMGIDGQLVLVCAGSTALHTTYGVMVQAAYKHFDLGQTYPISRGLAPVIVAVSGALVLHQPLGPTQWLGVVAMAVALACLLFDNSGPHPGMSRRGVTWSVLIAATIAAYSTYDGWAIVSLGLDPLPYITVSTVMQLLLVTALLRGDVRSGLVQLRRHPRPIVVLAVLIPASYALGLVATQHAPVSVVTAVRSSSIVWAAVAAVVVLREPMRRGRLAATLLCSAALVAMAL